MSRLYDYLNKIFGLTKAQSNLWLVSVVIFLMIGLFVRSSGSDFSAYGLAALLFGVNCFIMAILKQVGRIRLAIVIFLLVLNFILFGYYYFNSITVFF
jgi:hypothetical protein